MTVIVCTERNEAELRELLINYSIGGCNQADHFVVDVDCHCSVACLLTDQQFAHTHTRTHARTHARTFWPMKTGVNVQLEAGYIDNVNISFNIAYLTVYILKKEFTLNICACFMLTY